MKYWKHALSALAAALVVAGCGGCGEGAPTANTSGITSVKVVGDSLSDSSTFGFKFAMQGSATEPMLLWTERIAASYGVAALCPRYAATSATTVAPNPSAAACSSYAVGGGRINIPTAPTSPFSILQQLKDLAAEKSYGAGDLLLVDGGGNDAGAAYGGLLGTLLPAATVGAQLSAGPAGAANAGGLSMTALADKMFDAVKTPGAGQGRTQGAGAEHAWHQQHTALSGNA